MNPIPRTSSVVAAFDFDLTMTTRDTFRLFLAEAFGRARLAHEAAKLAPEFAKLALGRGDRDRLKERLVHALFEQEPAAPLQEFALAFEYRVRRLLRPAAVERLNWHREQGHRCVMVSASLDVYLRPIAAHLGFHDLLCTTLEVAHRRPAPEADTSGEPAMRRFTGQLVGANCRRQEKVSRLTGLLGDLDAYRLFAYGDSVGDRELLAVADHPHYRVFEPGRMDRGSPAPAGGDTATA